MSQNQIVEIFIYTGFILILQKFIKAGFFLAYCKGRYNLLFNCKIPLISLNNMQKYCIGNQCNRVCTVIFFYAHGFFSPYKVLEKLIFV